MLLQPSSSEVSPESKASPQHLGSADRRRSRGKTVGGECFQLQCQMPSPPQLSTTRRVCYTRGRALARLWEWSSTAKPRPSADCRCADDLARGVAVLSTPSCGIGRSSFVSSFSRSR